MTEDRPRPILSISRTIWRLVKVALLFSWACYTAHLLVLQGDKWDVEAMNAIVGAVLLGGLLAIAFFGYGRVGSETAHDFNIKLGAMGVLVVTSAIGGITSCADKGIHGPKPSFLWFLSGGVLTLIFCKTVKE